MLGAVLECPHLDAGRIALGGELQRIREEVGEDMLEQRRVALAHRQLRDGELDGTPLVLGLEIPDHPLRQLGERQRLRLERLTAETRQVEQIVDQTVHALGAQHHLVQHAASVGSQTRAVIGEEGFAETRDPVQWRTQVVRYRVREGLEVRIARLELACTLLDPVFELLVDASQLADQRRGCQGRGGRAGQDVQGLYLPRADEPLGRLRGEAQNAEQTAVRHDGKRDAPVVLAEWMFEHQRDGGRPVPC